KMDVGLFVKYGYSPYNGNYHMQSTPQGSGFAASHTMEYAFSSYAVAQLAKHLGKMDDYNKLMELSNGWKHLFDNETKLIRPKDENGKFIEDFDPLAPWIGFQEGNAVQYTFYVPHHIDELIQRADAEVFVDRLDAVFTQSQKNIFGGGTTVDAFSGLSALYNHGNQPNLHVSWLFNYTDKPYLSQKWVRAICNEFYGTEPMHGYGYGQDEDQGQLGAWHVMSAIGMSDITGLTRINTEFQIGSPLFKKITIKLNNEYYPGRKFVIKTKANADSPPYVQHVSVNGRRQDVLSIPYKQIINGGKLILEMGEKPNYKLKGNI